MKRTTKWLLTALTCGIFSAGQHGFAAAETEETYDTYTLPEVTLVGVPDDRIAGGLLHKTNAVGLLGTKDARDTPFQAMTFDQTAIEQFTVPNRNILDVLTLNPAVRAGQGATDSRVTIRGISSNGNAWYINGVPGIAHQKDMSANFIGQVTVISGPAVGIRGTTSDWQENVGGIVDMTSKRATDEGTRNVKLGFHGRSYFSQEIDVGERIGKQKDWGIRINAMQGQGSLGVENARMWKRNIFVNIDHKDDRSKTNLLMGYDYTRERGNGNSLIVPATIKSLPRAPKGSINLSPSWSEDEYDNIMFVLNHEQKLNDHMQAFLNAGYHKENYTSWIQGYNRRLLDDAGNYEPLSAAGYGTGYSQWPVAHATKYVGVGLRGDFLIGAWKNEYTASLDRMWFWRQTIGSYGSDPAERYIPAPGNIYRSNSAVLPAQLPKKPLRTQYKSMMTGWHLLDAITAPGEKLTLVLGLHGHRGERARNYSGSNARAIDASATCPTYAVVYKFTPQMTAYANHSESFSEGSVVSGAGYANNGEVIPPAKTRQNEIGFKYENRGIVQSLSLYRMKRQGTNDVFEGGNRYLRIDKEQKYEGIEYSAVGELSEKLHVIFGLNCINARQTNGQSVLGLPKWSSTLATVYKPTKQWSIIGRVDYLRSAAIRYGSDPLAVPSITTFDLGAHYETKIAGQDVLFSLMCNNVFDRKFWYSSTGSSSIFLGRPRTLSLAATVSL